MHIRLYYYTVTDLRSYVIVHTIFCFSYDVDGIVVGIISITNGQLAERFR